MGGECSWMVMQRGWVQVCVCEHSSVKADRVKPAAGCVRAAYF